MTATPEHGTMQHSAATLTESSAETTNAGNGYRVGEREKNVTDQFMVKSGRDVYSSFNVTRRIVRLVCHVSLCGKYESCKLLVLFCRLHVTPSHGFRQLKIPFEALLQNLRLIFAPIRRQQEHNMKPQCSHCSSPSAAQTKHSAKLGRSPEFLITCI